MLINFFLKRLKWNIYIYIYISESHEDKQSPRHKAYQGSLQEFTRESQEVTQ
jgi:hypothetical protein